jgi:small subunit ribosomal protein S24e
MSFEITILEEQKNPLIKRNEIKFRVDHFGKGTPNRLEIKKKLAAMKNADEKLTIIRRLKGHFGSAYTLGTVNIYEKSNDIQFFEPFHIQVRNVEAEKRAEIYRLKKRKEPYKHLFQYE